jgi:gliding motility-associated peptidyl-prolyl isomerase
MKTISIFLLLFAFISCTEDEPIKVLPKSNWNTDESINMQSTFLAEENDEIDSFLKHHTDWKMTKTGSGLRYFIYEKSEHNDTAKVYDEVSLYFEVKLLDGTICYTQQEEIQKFMIEKTDIESGLHEALKYMCTNDKALFILPSHLAHGLIGDQDKIPPLQSLIYDIHLIKIN